jgi:hypothetical protein
MKQLFAKGVIRYSNSIHKTKILNLLKNKYIILNKNIK